MMANREAGRTQEPGAIAGTPPPALRRADRAAAAVSPRQHPRQVPLPRSRFSVPSLPRRYDAQRWRASISTTDSGGRLAAASQSEQPKVVLAADLVPAHLLDGGEVVLFAIKPSLWFVLFASVRWLVVLAAAIGMAPWLATASGWTSGSLIAKAALALAAARVGFAVLEWASRLYVLTNRRVMRIRGIFNIHLFECSLLKIENTGVLLTWYQRLFGLGTVSFATAGTGPYAATWEHVAHPLEVHEQIRAAIGRARGSRG